MYQASEIKAGASAIAVNPVPVNPEPSIVLAAVDDP